MGRIELDERVWVPGYGYRKNKLVNETMLSCPGTLVQMVEMAPGEMIPDHIHQTSTEFYYVASGECRLVINEESHLMRPGDMYLMRPGDVHRLYNEGSEPFRLLVFKTNAAPDDTFWR